MYVGFMAGYPVKMCTRLRNDANQERMRRLEGAAGREVIRYGKRFAHWNEDAGDNGLVRPLRSGRSGYARTTFGPTTDERQ